MTSKNFTNFKLTEFVCTVPVSNIEVCLHYLALIPLYVGLEEVFPPFIAIRHHFWIHFLHMYINSPSKTDVHVKKHVMNLLLTVSSLSSLTFILNNR